MVTLYWHRRFWQMMDWWLFLLVLAIAGAGFVVITAAAPADEIRADMIKQGAALAMGVIACVILILLDYTEFRGFHWVLYGLNILMLLTVVFFGMEINGNKNWINLGIVQIQPSELGKILLIITLGRLLDSMERLHTWLDLFAPIVHVLPIFALVILQGDLGTALVFIVISVGMVYAAGFPGTKIAGVVLVVTALVVGLVYSHYTYQTNFPIRADQWKRIDTFLHPEEDPQGAGYQVLQSKLAIGTGDIWGKGYGNGDRHALGWLPYPHTDFVFAVVSEEWGFAGGVGVIGLYGLIFFRLFTVAYSARDRYGALITIGVAALFAAHVLENIGMTMGVTPVTGIPLPFISYGPTALLANLAAVGLVQSVAVRRDPVQL